MKNDFEFWEKYNKYIIKRIKSLLLQNKKYYYVDMHIHTKYSSDGFDSIKAKIKRAQKCGFDIIAFTDHDSVEALDDLFALYMQDEKKFKDWPIIIPGVEYTVNYNKYNGLCHVLHYFVNPKSEVVRQRLLCNEKAFWKRSQLQFERINCNYALQRLIKDYGVEINYRSYRKFLVDTEQKIPDYSNLINYIFSNMRKKGANVSDVKNLIYQMVKMDSCRIRKCKYISALERFEKRHKKDINEKGNLLLPLLAPVGIDDCDYLCEPIGVLTVNRYEQINLNDLTDNGFYVLAHPEVEQLDLLEFDIPINHKQISAYEINKSNYRSNIEDIKGKALHANLFYTIGSDSHSIQDSLYSDIYYFKYPHEQLDLFVKKGEKSMNTELKQYSSAANLNARIRLHEKYSINNEGFHEWVFSKMNIHENMKILECGCGPGMLWRKNRNRIPKGCQITLLDMSEGMLREAKNNIEEIPSVSFTYLSGDIQNIPFPNETFHIVIANHMLYHVPDIHKALLETKRVLIKGGFLYASTFGLNHLKELDLLTRKYVELNQGRKSDRFTLENGREMIYNVYNNITIEKHQDALVVTDYQAIIDYILSGNKAQEQLTGKKKENFEADIKNLFMVNKELRIGKDAGTFIARKVDV